MRAAYPMLQEHPPFPCHVVMCSALAHACNACCADGEQVLMDAFARLHAAGTAASAITDAALAALVSSAFQVGAGQIVNASFSVSDGVLGSGVAM